MPLLTDWSVPPIDVWAVTPQRGQQPAHVRHAIAALQRHFAVAPGTAPKR